MESTSGPSNSSASFNLPTKTRRKTKPRAALPGSGRFSIDESPDTVASQSIHRALDPVPTTPSNAFSFQFKPPITPLSAVHPSLSNSHSRPTTRVEPDPFASASPIPDLNNPFPLLDEPLPFHNTEYEPVSARQRDGRSPAAKIHDHLRALRADKLSPLDVLVQALDPDFSEDIRYRKNLYSADDNRLTMLLDTIMKDDYGKRKLFECMCPHLEDFACNIVAEQMECRRKASFLQGINDVTPEFIDNWSLDEDTDRTPFLTRILYAASQTKHAATHNKLKRPEKMCRVVTKQLLYQSSNRCLGFQAEFGLFLWSTGCVRQTIDALFRCGLSVGQTVTGLREQESEGLAVLRMRR
ncbi:hypothetical protein B0H16DRAFT_240962 [Mycena metata]|uniref:Uncharacterized protein n=1 Tax=Mycena metata TaxID=1033252 RepID=A0AAD7HW52_9AGAR|nr:hypothetical protein B0H16DRAFT_240962 [Mycena metata]